LYPKRGDEWVAYKVLLQQDDDIKPDMVLLVADASNLKRNLLFCSQIIDLKVPVVLALSMMDLAGKNGTQIDIAGLERELGVPVVSINPRRGKGIPQLKKIIDQTASNHLAAPREFISSKALAEQSVAGVKHLFPVISDYAALHYLINHEHFKLGASAQDTIEGIEIANKFNPTRTQAEEIMQLFV
jgi:ferrous iron transport protein B